MKWLVIITNWIEKETWWRRHYRRITLPNKIAWCGRCLECSAATGELQCSIKEGRECPCEWGRRG